MLGHFVRVFFLFFSTIAYSAQHALEPLKGKSDPASYRQITLDNGLRVLLISDERVIQSIAALSVGTGYYDDPKSVAGAAHLLEHVVSKGSARFPDAAEYKQFLADNGGASNASTSALTTTYHFYVNAKEFDGALMRFASQFDSPLLKPKTILHEANAVESEFRLKYTDNYRKYREVLRLAFNREHPYRKFSTGNRATLIENNPKKTITAVTEIFDKYYFSENMGLVLFGPQSIEELELMATTYFGRIRSGKKATIARNFVKPIKKLGLNKLIKIKPLTNKRRLSMNYLVPGRYTQGNEGIGKFLSWVIDGKQVDGLEAYLQEKELIYDLKTSLNEIDKAHDLLTIEFRMTPDGLKSADRILSAVYDFFAVLTNPKSFKATYQIYRDIQFEKFSRREQSWNRNGIRNLSKNLLRTKSGVATSLANLPSEFDFDSTKIFLRALASDQLIMVTQNNLYQIGGKHKSRGRFKKITQKGLVEPIYNTPFHFVNLNWNYAPINDIEFKLPSYPKYFSKSEGGKRNSELQVSKNNKEKEYESSNQINFVINPQSQKKEISIAASGYKAISLYWDNPDSANSSNFKNKILNKLLHKRIKHSLASIRDEARDSFISLSTETTDSGIAINLSGYQVSFAQVLKDIIRQIKSCNLTDKELKATYRSLLIELKPRSTDRLKAKFSNRLKTHFNEVSTSTQNYLILKEVNESQYSTFRETFFDNSRLMIYATRNIDEQAVASVLGDFALDGSIKLKSVLKRVEMTGLFEQKIKDKGNGVLRVSFSNLKPVEAEIFTQLLAKRIKAPMFHELRTNQQLGYRVSATTKRIAQNTALELYVESPTTDSEDIRDALSSFIKSFLNDLKKESYEEFIMQKDAFTNFWLASNNSLKDRFKKSIWADRYNLSKTWRKEAISFIKKLDKEKFLSLARDYLESKSENEIMLMTISQ